MQTAGPGAMQQAIGLMEKTPLLFETMLGDLAVELLQWKPAPDRWSISEVLGHLVDSEKVLFERARRLVEEDSPTLRKYEPPTAGFAQRPALEQLSRFTAMRRDTVTFLKTVPSTAGDRMGSHSEIGPITLEQMLNEWASHDLGHLRQVAELFRAKAFHPYAGPFQRYSNPKP